MDGVNYLKKIYLSAILKGYRR